VGDSRTTRSRACRRRAAVEWLEGRCLLHGPGPLVISEFLADNATGLRDENGEYADWIEVHNPTAADVSLDGYTLTDDPGLPAKWRLPAVTLPADGYLVVFASGGDRTGPQPHANFKLAAEGEYLALVRPDGVTVSDAYAPRFPGQVGDVSYGVLGGVERYFTAPTPGAANADGSTGVVAGTAFSVDRGFFEAPFELRIATPTAGAEVRYTTDGTKPTATTGTPYTGPITVSKTTALRAAAFKPGLVPSGVETHTYIFVDDVVRQTRDSTIATGFPPAWGTATADYGMDPDVIGQTGPDLFRGLYAATIRDDLKAIPTMSIVLPVDDMFGPNGIYSQSAMAGDAWERGTSVELVDPTGGGAGREFQVDAGIQIQGGAFRSHGLTKKHSFRLVFKDKWGPSKLEFPLFGPGSADRFDTITLRADANDMWNIFPTAQYALYSRDMWTRATQRAMGQPSSDGNRVHLYINGIYWGLYNPTERPDAAFAAAYIGGDKDQWDILNSGVAVDGDTAAWDTMLALAQAVADAPDEASRTAAYQRVQGNNPDGTDNPAYQDYLDVDSLIDYMLLNIFITNVDWPHRNWYAGRLRADTGVGSDATGFKFFSWDAETALPGGDTGYAGQDRTIVTLGPAQPYDRLRSSPDFRARFADRVQTHMFGNGALSTANNKARMAEIAAQIDRAIVAESARWGDQGRAAPITRERWLAELQRVNGPGGFFDGRWELALGQLRLAGLYPAADAPRFGQPPGQLPAGAAVNIAGAGTVYYTLDGSDPRRPDGSPDPAAHSLAVPGKTLIPAGSVWKYLDNGSNQGGGWRGESFDDSLWASGPAQLGFGDGDEATVVNRGPGGTAGYYLTTYFRKAFTVDDPSPLTSLRLRLLHDDGAVVYLNGQRVVSSNFNATAPFTHTTRATRAVNDAEERIFFEFNVAPALLRTGNNVLAVEVHQFSTSTEDLSFDLELFAPAPSVPVTLPVGTTHLRARARDAAGNWSALSEAVYHAGPAASAGSVAVTEVHYNPAPPEAALGETPVGRGDYEFVELMNTSGQRVALYGARFGLGIKFDFPVDAYLDPGERAVVVKDVASFRSRYGNGPRVLGAFTGNLGNDGQLIILRDARGQLIDSFRYGDSGDWPGRADGNGASLEVIDTAGDYNDPGNWRSSREFGGTPGAPGTGPLPGVVVNEVLANTDAPQADRVELFNPTAAAVDLGGWYLSDSAADYRKFRIPDGNVLQPGAHLVFDESALGFALDGEGDDVWLVEADRASGRLTRFVDRVEFGPTAPGAAAGRWPSGSPGARLYPMSPTIGLPNAGPTRGPLVINEIHYAPAAGGQEFIELYNPTTTAVSLDGWRFTDGIDYAFGADAVLAPGGYLLLVSGDPAAFRAAHGVPAGVPVVGGFTAGGFLNVLDNAGERLTFSRPGAAVPGGEVPFYEVDTVRYGMASPWAVAANGASLARRWAQGWSDAAANWGSESGGSPGRANFGGAAPAPFVAGRHVFDNNSAADGHSAAAGHPDDGAISPKQALLPGQRATFSNVTGYVRGINGVMIDLAVLPAGATPTGADFELHVGNGTAWAAVPALSSFSVRRGAGVGGSDRITLTFPDGAIRNTWLRVTVGANARTGLAQPDAFYFGNLVGDTGPGGTPVVNAIDLARVRGAVGTAKAALKRQYDLNRDGAVNAVDVLIVRANQRRSLPLFSAPAATITGSFSATRTVAPVVPVRSASPLPRRSVWNSLQQ
jgi:hypothetical protein